jgi:hypothetical protein
MKKRLTSKQKSQIVQCKRRNGRLVDIARHFGITVTRVDQIFGEARLEAGEIRAVGQGGHYARSLARNRAEFDPDTAPIIRELKKRQLDKQRSVHQWLEDRAPV